MNRFYLFISFILIIPALAFGQLKIGYVDSVTIMEKLPDAQDARQRLDVLIQDWQTELNTLESGWKSKYDDYEKRKLIMNDQTRVELEKELVKLEQQIAE